MDTTAVHTSHDLIRYGGLARSMQIGGIVSGGTAQAILFVGAGGVLAQDNADFKYDAGTNSLFMNGSGAKSANFTAMNTGSTATSSTPGISRARQDHDGFPDHRQRIGLHHHADQQPDRRRQQRIRQSPTCCRRIQYQMADRPARQRVFGRLFDYRHQRLGGGLGRQSRDQL